MLCFVAEVLGLAPAPANSDQATNLFSSSSFRDSDNNNSEISTSLNVFIIHELYLCIVQCTKNS